MADFIHNGWSLFIIGTTVVSIIACFWLAITLSSARTPKAADGSVDDTGHTWDEDLRELNHPLPRWWLYLFYLTCIFGLLYLFLYPGAGSYPGQFKWSQTSQYDAEVAKAKAVYEPLFAQFLAQDIKQVAANPEARAMGERLYLTYCVQCHGSDARGSRGFPNLADNDWLGAGTPEYIKEVALKGRQAVMPPMAAAVGGGEHVTNVAHYVLSLSGSASADPLRAALGRDRFTACAACHGADGKGNAAIGAPNLTDKTWLYGGSLASIEEIINKGVQNNMPAFGHLLGEGKAHVLAAYVWSLSNHDKLTEVAR